MEELEYFEVITLDKDADSFVDDDGMYQFSDGKWFELFTNVSRAVEVVVH